VVDEDPCVFVVKPNSFIDGRFHNQRLSAHLKILRSVGIPIVKTVNGSAVGYNIPRWAWQLLTEHGHGHGIRKTLLKRGLRRGQQDKQFRRALQAVMVVKTVGLFLRAQLEAPPTPKEPPPDWVADAEYAEYFRSRSRW